MMLYMDVYNNLLNPLEMFPETSRGESMPKLLNA